MDPRAPQRLVLDRKGSLAARFQMFPLKRYGFVHDSLAVFQNVMNTKTMRNRRTVLQYKFNVETLSGFRLKHGVLFEIQLKLNTNSTMAERVYQTPALGAAKERMAAIRTKDGFEVQCRRTA